MTTILTGDTQAGDTRAGDTPARGTSHAETNSAATTTNGWIRDTTTIAFGGDYNPEQWPRAVWEEDVALMREAGVNLVSIGIFSWALLEPREGEFDFGWLDDVIELLWDSGVSVDLGTPTASPPAWFWAKYPEARPITKEGIALGFGSRGMASPSSPEYAEATSRIVRALGERYGAHPAVKLWHVHNEYGAPVSDCYSDHSVRAFRVWLRQRYESLDRLNAAWGTAFWGQNYGEWEHIDAPRQSASTVNPAQKLDFARFTNHALLQCFRRERDILRELSPGVPVTTNFMATNCPSVDLWTWAPEVDIIANDYYLVAERTDNHILLSMDADLSRSLGRGKPWILMEHSTSAVNWQGRNIAKRAGELARNSMATYARGADGILFFQWRASRYGSEKFHSAMVPHAGPSSRIFRETTALGADLGRLAETLGSRVSAKVAILWEWESFWAQDLEWRPSVDLNHRRQIENWYSRLWLDGITTDFAHPESDLSGYDLVLAPSLYLMTEEATANIEGYVSEGGVFVSGYFSGIVGPNDTVLPGASPGALRSVLGLSIQEFLPLRKDETVGISNGLRGTIWSDDIVLEGATAVATYADGPARGGAAITRNDLGSGSAWYISTELDIEQLGGALAGPFAAAGIRPPEGTLPGVERVDRHLHGTVYTVWINHTEADVALERTGVTLNGGTDDDPFLLAAGSVSVIRHTEAPE